MTSVTHAKVSAKSDGGDATLVLPSDWNAEHVIDDLSSGPNLELDYVQITSNVTVTATTEATANTVVTGSAVTYDGSTTILVEFFAPTWNLPDTLDAVSRVYIYDGSSSIGRLTTALNPTGDSAGTGLIVPVYGARRLTPSAGSHTYSIRADTSTGTTTIGAGAGGNGNVDPAFIRITRANGGAALGTPPGVSLINSGVQNIGAGAVANLTFDTEEFDSDGFHSGGSPTRITIPAGLGGRYLLKASTHGTGHADDESFYVGIEKNAAGNVFARGYAISRGTVDADSAEVVVVVEAVAGDYYEVEVTNQSAGARDFGHASADRARSRFQAIRLGGGGSATGSETFLTSPVTLTSTNTFYDGPSQSCAAGNWLFVGSVEVQINGAAGFIEAKLWDGTTVFQATGSYIDTDSGTITIPVSAYAVLSSTQTVKISVARSAGNSTSVILDTSIGGNGTTDKASKIVCIKLA